MRIKRIFLIMISIFLIFSSCSNQSVQDENTNKEKSDISMETNSDILANTKKEDEEKISATRWELVEELGTTNEIKFKNGIRVLVPDNWVGRFELEITEYFNSQYNSVKLLEKKNADKGFGGVLLNIEFISKDMVPKGLYLFSCDRLVGIYKDFKSEYALVVLCTREMMYDDANQELKEAYKELYDTIDELQILTDEMENFTECSMEVVDWVKPG